MTLRWLVRNLVFAVTTIAGGFAGLVVHEIVGHALLAYLFGARAISVRLNPDFTGSVHFDGASLSLWQNVVVDSGGIAVNLVSGFGALLLERRVRATWLRRFLVVFGGISVYKALEYLATSLYLGDGRDPLQHADVCAAWHTKGYWVLPLLAVPLALHPFGRAMARVEQVGLSHLLAITAPTLVLGGIFYYRGWLFHGGGALSSGLASGKFCGGAPQAFGGTFPILPCVILLAVFGAVLGARARGAVEHG